MSLEIYPMKKKASYIISDLYLKEKPQKQEVFWANGKWPVTSMAKHKGNHAAGGKNEVITDSQT